MRRSVMIFNRFKRFVGLFASQLQASHVIGVTPPTIKAVCDGRGISTKEFYLRWFNPDVGINVKETLGVLTLKEYDNMCGTERKVYKDSKMNRKGWKYNTKVTPKKLKTLRKKWADEAV